MAALDPQAHIAMLERELQWAHSLKRNCKSVLEERLRQRRIQVLGPQSETLSDLQLELLAEEEPGATARRSGSRSAARTPSTKARSANASRIRGAARCRRICRASSR